MARIARMALWFWWHRQLWPGIPVKRWSRATMVPVESFRRPSARFSFTNRYHNTLVPGLYDGYSHGHAESQHSQRGLDRVDPMCGLR
jgi:hypothetical protein